MIDVLTIVFVVVFALTFAVAVALGFAQARRWSAGDFLGGCVAATVVAVLLLLPAFAYGPDTTDSTPDLAATRLLLLPGALASCAAVGYAGALIVTYLTGRLLSRRPSDPKREASRLAPPPEHCHTP